MTEAEWLACDAPQAMFDRLREAKSERKMRLLAVAACRRLSHLLVHEASRAAVDFGERAADEAVSEAKRGAAFVPAYEAWIRIAERYGQGNVRALAAQLASNCADLPRWRGFGPFKMESIFAPYHWPHPYDPTFRAGAPDRKAFCDMVRCVFGNLVPPAPDRRGWFGRLWRAPDNSVRVVTADPSWLTSTVVLLARQMYESREFSAMPILADALQDAGCDCDDILAHCRDTTATHVRGCWVVDLVLGKE